MAQQGGGGGGQGEDTYKTLWLIALVGFIGFVIWLAAGEQLKEAFLWFRRYQLIVLDKVLMTFHIEDVHETTQWVRTATRNDLTLVNAKSLSELTGKYYRYFYGLFFLGFSWRIFLK